MPYSKRKQAAWMRAYRAKKKMAGTVLMPKAFVRRLAAQGTTPMRYLGAIPVSLDDYRAQGRLLEAKNARVEWQSSGIRMLHQKTAALEGTISMMRTMDNSQEKQRIMLLEANQTLREAQEVYDAEGKRRRN